MKVERVRRRGKSQMPFATFAAIDFGVVVAAVIALMLIKRAFRRSPRGASGNTIPGPGAGGLHAPPPGHPHAGDPRYLAGSDYHRRSAGAAHLPWFVRQAQGFEPTYNRSDFYPPS